MVVTTKISILWVVMVCNLVEIYWHCYWYCYRM